MQIGLRRGNRVILTRTTSQTRTCVKVVCQMAQRINGCTSREESIQVLCQQKWSGLLVPLFWAASDSSREHMDFLEWASHLLGTEHNRFSKGWTSLQQWMRNVGITNQQDLSTWIMGKLGIATRPGGYITCKTQELILDTAVDVNTDVSELERGIVDITLTISSHPGMLYEIVSNLQSRKTTRRQRMRRTDQQRGRMTIDPSPMNSTSTWAAFDNVDLRELYWQRVQTLQTCPAFFRDAYRQAQTKALKEI